MPDDPESFSSKIIDIIIYKIDDKGVVELYRGRSEMGPRAWEHQYILADPRRRGMKRFFNKLVKGREYFRSFAPSVLEEYADEWFNISR